MTTLQPIREYKYVLDPFFEHYEKYLDYYALISNYNAVDYLNAHIDTLKIVIGSWKKFNMYDKCSYLYSNKNPKIFELIERNWCPTQSVFGYTYIVLEKHNIGMFDLCENPNAINFIENHWEELKTIIKWNKLFKNPNAIELIQKHWFVCKNYKHFSNGAYYFIELCENPSPKAMDFIIEHWDEVKEYLDWRSLSRNPNIMKLVDSKWAKIKNKLYAEEICSNPNAIKLIKKHWDYLISKNRIFWYGLCSNSNAIDLIKTHWTTIDPKYYVNLSSNINAIPLIIEKWDNVKDHLNWRLICCNPSVGQLLNKKWPEIKSYITVTDADDERHVDYCWSNLCKNPNAIDFITSHYDEIKDFIVWEELYENPNAIHLIKTHWNIYIEIKCKMYCISYNPALFIDSYTIAAKAYFMSHIWPELTAYIFHPTRMHNHKDLGFVDILFE